MKRTHSSHITTHTDAETCIALIDARFLAWLQGQLDAPQDHVRTQLHPLLDNALAQNGLELNLRRIYWYSDALDGQAVGGQISRAVLPHSQDGGLSILRTLGADLKRLAERGACNHLLVGSDDERLISLIDEAQLHGVSVHLLADEASRNMTELNREDPGWARLLSQADQRVVLGAQTLREAGSPRHVTSMHTAPKISPEQLRGQLQTVITTWWEAEPEDLREDLREELQNTRGLPQEVDRQLLLAVRRVLERALSFHEKKMLREMVRDQVLGTQSTPDQSDTPVVPVVEYAD